MKNLSPILLCSLSYLLYFDNFSSFILQISLAKVHSFHKFFSKIFCEISCFKYHKPYKLQKFVTNFPCIYHFSLKEFSKKIKKINM